MTNLSERIKAVYDLANKADELEYGLSCALANKSGQESARQCLLNFRSQLATDFPIAVSIIKELEAKVIEYEQRLEIAFAINGDGETVPFPEGAPDGIECRDTTIKYMGEILAKLRAKLELAVKGLEELANKSTTQRSGWNFRDEAKDILKAISNNKE